jgi:DNA-binding response OmpR family regulator
MIEEKQILLSKKILIIGGDVTLLNSLEKALLYAGADVKISTTGVNGLVVARNEKPDVILLDSSADDMTIDKFVVAVKSDRLIDTVPLIIVTDDENFDIDGKISSVISKKNLKIDDVINAFEYALTTTPHHDTDDVLDISEISSAPIISETEEGMRVMVIEDDPLLRSLLSARLEKSKIPYQFCHNGTDAMEAIERYKPTIVILDIMLPGQSGLDVLAEMRESRHHKDTPVVIFSNKDSSEDRDLAASLNVKAFFVKAMTDLNDLVNLILKQN